MPQNENCILYCSKTRLLEQAPPPSQPISPQSIGTRFVYPFPKQQFLDSSKPKEFAVDNFKFNENGGKFSKRLENTVGKGEIARFEQFLLFPWCFQKTCNADT